ncbi:MAG: hypothetical protein QXS20_05035 [Candidatus Thorarchaeota archaeon]
MNSVILTHGDLDGITSGAIALMALPGSSVFFTRPSQIQHDLARLARDEPELISISDIAVNRSSFSEILKALNQIPSKTTVLWTDHHPIDNEHRKKLSERVDYFNETGSCAAELVYRRFEDRLPDGAVLLALYGSIGDYCDNSPFAVKRFEDLDKRTIYFEAGILVQALQEMDYTKGAKETLYHLALGIQPSSMSQIVEMAVKATRVEHEVFRYVQQHVRKLGPVGYVLDMPLNGYRGKSAKFAAYCAGGTIGISGRSFGNEVDLSLRRRDSDIDLNVAVQRVLSGIPEAQGGGHPAAAGASLQKVHFSEFVKNLAEYAIRAGADSVHLP